MRKYFSAFFICFGITIITLFVGISGCREVQYDMKQPKYRPYQEQNMHHPQEPSSELFRRMIIQNIQPYVGHNSADTSPAVVVGLVTRKGPVVVAMGRRDIFSSTPPDGETLFGIGSISKLFTGLILARAVAGKELSLTDKANTFLEPEIQIDDRITLRHLVTHFSGLPNFPDNIMDRKERFQDQRNAQLMPAENYSRQDLKNCLVKHKCIPEHPPGKKYQYSNLGMGLLGIVLENRYGYNDFNSLVQAKVTNVLHMDKTATNNPAFIKRNTNNLAQGYQYNPTLRSLKPVPFSNMGVLAGSGELISSANDLILLLKLMTGLSKSPLENAAKEVQLTLENTDQPRIRTAYAHKIRMAQDDGIIHFKTGGTAGYSSIILWRKNPEVGLVFLTNRGNFRQLLPLSQQLMGKITQQLK